MRVYDERMLVIQSYEENNAAAAILIALYSKLSHVRVIVSLLYTVHQLQETLMNTHYLIHICNKYAEYVFLGESFHYCIHSGS